MRRLGLILVAVFVAALICIPIIPQNADAQTSQNTVSIKTDYQMLGLSELHGGGHLTYELRGTAARDLR
jgi:preprotein translocase subunit SecD